MHAYVNVSIHATLSASELGLLAEDKKYFWTLLPSSNVQINSH